ncbi:hypothetical protein D3C76_1370490 [compost metagenome]
MAFQLVDIQPQARFVGLDLGIDDPAGGYPPQTHGHQGEDPHLDSGCQRRNPEHKGEKAEKHRQHNNDQRNDDYTHYHWIQTHKD